MQIQSHKDFKNMNTAKATENRSTQRARLGQRPAVSNSKHLWAEDVGKNEMFDKLRIKLGKTAEEFQKIFDLYYHLLNRQNP